MLKFLRYTTIVLAVLVVAAIVYRHEFNGSFPWDGFLFSRDTTPLTTQNPDTFVGDPASRPDPERDFAYAQLASPEERSLYVVLLSGLKGHAETISFNPSPSTAVKNAVDAVLADHPELFWTEGAYTYTGISNTTVTSISPDYTLDEQTSTQLNAQLEKTADDFLATLDPDASEFDRTMAIHDHLVDSTAYDLAEYHAVSVPNDHDDYSIVGPLINGRAVCQGYSKAFQYLMQRDDRFCTYVSGTATNELGTQTHAWNMVRIDGVYSYVDCTFDDPIVDDGSVQTLSYNFFCVGSDLLLDDHTPAYPPNLPPCETLTS
jgi:hypothetical protein